MDLVTRFRAALAVPALFLFVGAYAGPVQTVDPSAFGNRTDGAGSIKTD